MLLTNALEEKVYLVIAHDTITKNAFKHKFYKICGY